MAEEMRLAIVGSTRFVTDGPAIFEAFSLIGERIRLHSPSLIISGGAEGVDTYANISAHVYGIGVQVFLPKNKRWEPEGYKDRNALIAESCTHLLAIRHRLSKTYGSGWTADYAERLGRNVERVVLG